ncbi:hypothetical protein [Desulfovibrio inopinatus]|uniref:hypothetical protein n=1 Tax=Desulfovibrio inopinatus TaxID=102109 RepID=UPI000428C813|nr:hypothetical protein [Desulfovibrio inopinatus]
MTQIFRTDVSDVRKAQHDWREVSRRGPAGFVTRVEHEHASGVRALETSRRDRKQRGPLYDPAPFVRALDAWLHWWAPDRLTWWVAVTFIIGSSCFIAGAGMALAPFYDWASFNVTAINQVYAVGSIFFSLASYLQFVEAINSERGAEFFVRGTHTHNPRFRFFAWEPRHLPFLATASQFVGALCFNVDCFFALVSGLTWQEVDMFLWGPSMIGSVLFLVSGYLSVIEVVHRLWAILPRDISWWVVFINFIGCVFFFVGSAMAFSWPGLESANLAALSNGGTLLGAVCFFLSSFLMIPEMFSQ